MENAANKQLQGLRISLGDAVLELDSETKTPNVRARNIVLRDEDGAILAAAPKAGVALDQDGATAVPGCTPSAATSSAGRCQASRPGSSQLFA